MCARRNSFSTNISEPLNLFPQLAPFLPSSHTRQFISSRTLPQDQSPTMSKLSPTLKQLINAAHARPGPLPAPRNVQSVFKKIEQEATDHKLGRPSWLAVSTAATMTLNSPESMEALFHSSTQGKKLEESVQTAEFMREVALKCIGFNGVRSAPFSPVLPSDTWPRRDRRADYR